MVKSRTVVTAAFSLLSPVVVPAQPAPVHQLAFEVAAVKPSAVDQQPTVNFTLGAGDNYVDIGGMFETKGISLLDYVRFAYKLSDGQVDIMLSKAPAWISSERFDIAAKSSREHPSKDDMRSMMRSLLADRFALKTHTETQTLPVLAMVPIKAGIMGPSLQAHTWSDTACAASPRDPSQPSVVQAPALCGGIRSSGVPSAPSRVRLSGTAVSMTALAAQLGQMGGFTRPVVDQTGVTGLYDFTLEWGPESAAEPTDETSRETYLQDALRKQLGIKLNRQTTPFQIILIDHIDRQPSQN